MANSPEYRTIIQLTPELTTALRNDLVKLSDELLAEDLISDNNAANLKDSSHNTADHRVSSLIALIRNRIKLDSENTYRSFVDVLKRRLSDHKIILRHLDEKYKDLGELTLLRLLWTPRLLICRGL